MAPPLVVLAVGILHCAFVGFMVLAPFATDRAWVAAHALVTPFLWLHWLLNDDSCVLTLVEARLRGVDDHDSFFYKVVSPVYKVRDEDVRVASWYASAALWAVTLARLALP